MQAILITCYTDKSNLIKLIKSFNDEMNIYVHIDKKSQEIFEEDLNGLNYKNLTIIKKYNISWGSYQHILAVIDLMKLAIANNENKFVHIISGQDYKIKSNSFFKEHFEENDNIYLSFETPENLSKPIEERYTKGVFSSYFSPENEKVRKINKLYRSLQNKNHIGQFKDIYKGALWGSMPIDVCKYIINYTENNPQYLEDLKHCIIPEEFFIQTIIMNSEFKSKVIANNLRYIDWTTKNGNNPAILDETDFSKIKNSGKLFIRKVDTEISSELIKLIDNNLLKEYVTKQDLITLINTKEFVNFPNCAYDIINKCSNELSCLDLFEIFDEIIECSSVWLNDSNKKSEELLGYFDEILEKLGQYNI